MTIIWTEEVSNKAENKLNIAIIQIWIFTDQKLLSQELKDTHEAFLMAKKYYKKYLKIYYTIEAKKGDKHSIFIQFFAEAKRDTDLYSIRLQFDTKTGVYQCESYSEILWTY